MLNPRKGVKKRRINPVSWGLMGVNGLFSWIFSPGADLEQPSRGSSRCEAMSPFIQPPEEICDEGKFRD